MTEPDAGRSALSDGEWHRLHPLTPLLRGGLFLVVVLGFVVANLRDRLIEIFAPWLAPGFAGPVPGDPVDYVLGHDLVLLALGVVALVVVALILVFWMSWRFHTFRITGDDVEVRSGVVFRTNRRAPLDRVQGVNLTRPLVARLLGLAKLEVVGAGLDANVRLEYLSTSNAEQVRADILRLASGRSLGESRPSEAGAATSWRSAAVQTASQAMDSLVAGTDEPEVEPASVVRIPPGRVIGSMLLRDSTIVILTVMVALVVWAATGPGWLVFAILPTMIGFATYVGRGTVRALRYAIAPTDHGVRIVFGILTTVTEILPPGRVHAVRVHQPILWRPAGWWTITVNRLSGSRAGQEAAEAFTRVLPVGTREDAERVVALLLPWLDETERALLFERGLLGAVGDPAFTTTPRRARILRPVSWRRDGFAVTDAALFLRRGRLWRSLVVVPLARLQSIALQQGPIDRALRVASARAHTVAGAVDTSLGAIDVEAARGMFEDVARRAVTAAHTDRSHRWFVEDTASLMRIEQREEEENG